MGLRKTAYIALAGLAIGCSTPDYTEHAEENRQMIKATRSTIAGIDSRTTYLERRVEDYLIPGRENQERHEQHEQAIEKLERRVTIAESDVKDAEVLSTSAEGAAAGMQGAVEKTVEALRNQGRALNDLRRYDHQSREWARESDNISKQYREESRKAWDEITKGWGELSIEEQAERLNAYIKKMEELAEENKKAHEKNGYSPREIEERPDGKRGGIS